jgi:hypothetical protein
VVLIFLVFCILLGSRSNSNMLIENYILSSQAKSHLDSNTCPFRVTFHEFTFSFSQSES